MPAGKRRAGRPRLRPEDEPTDYVGFRAPRDLKEKLEKAAKKAGRSLSTEAQFRLEESFHTEEFSSELSAMLQLIGRAVQNISITGNFLTGTIHADSSAWLYNPFIFQQLDQALRIIIDSLRPEGAPDFARQPGVIANPEFLELANRPDGLGVGYAEGLLQSVVGTISERPDFRSIREFGAELGRMFGPEVVDRIRAATHGRKST